MKGKMDDVNKKIKENSLNITKVLEELSTLRSNEYKRDDVVKDLKQLVGNFQSSLGLWDEK